VITFNERQLQRLLREYVSYYNAEFIHKRLRKGRMRSIRVEDETRGWGEAQLRWIVPIALVAFSALHFQPFLDPGLPGVIDGHSHLTRAWFVSQAFGEGQYPAWSNDWYAGHRLFGVHLAYYALTAVVALIFGDPVSATKWVLFSGQLVAALGLYAFVQRLSRRPLLAGFAALLLVTSSQREIVLGFHGNYPSLVIYAVFPLLLWQMASYSERAGAATALFAGQALLLGVLALGHLANAFAVLPPLLAFELHWLWQHCAERRQFVRGAAAIAGSLLALVGLLCFVLVLLWQEAGLVSLSLDATQATRGAGLEGLLAVAGFHEKLSGQPYVNSHGAFWFGLGLAGALLCVHPRLRRWRPLASGLAVALASAALFQQRAMVCVVFFLYPLCACALDAVSGAPLPGRSIARLLLPTLAIAGAVLWPADANVPAVKYARPNALDAYAGLPKSAAQSRTFDITPSGISLDGFFGLSSFSPYVSGRSIPLGAFPQGASLSTNVTMALLSQLGHDLRAPEPSLSEEVLDVLYLTHVEFLVDRSKPPVPRRLGLPAGSGRAVDARTIALRNTSPAVFAPRVEPLPVPFREAPEGSLHSGLLGALEAKWRRDPLSRPTVPSIDALFRSGRRRDWVRLAPLVRAMGLDRAGARCERLFSERHVAPGPGAASPASEFAVLEHRESSTEVEIHARSSLAGYVRLSYTHHPALDVRLDGSPVENIPDALGAIVLPFPAGSHTVSVRAPTSAPAGFLFSVTLGAALVFVLVASKLRGHRGRPQP